MNDRKLSKVARKLSLDADEVDVNSASVGEMSIKSSRRKLDVDIEPLVERIEANAFRELPRTRAARSRHNSPRIHPFVAPNVSPATKCFCIAKNIATEGSAARIEPADTRFHAVVH
jgi:hypothetical protein